MRAAAKLVFGVLLFGLPCPARASEEAYYERVSLLLELDRDLPVQFIRKFASCGALAEREPGGWWIHDDEGIHPGWQMENEDGEWVELDDEELDLAAVLQEILIWSEGAIPYLAYQVSLDCSKPRLDAYGGYAVFVPQGDIQTFSTGQWIRERIDEFNRRPNQKETPDV